METKDRTASFPSNYVSLKQLQELRLKESQEEEDRLRRQEEEEERLRRQKDEEERLGKFEEKEVEERGRRWRRIEEKAELRNPRSNPRSNAPIRRKWRRNGSRRPISGPSPNLEADDAAEAVGGSNRYPPASGRWREKQPAETDRTMKKARAYGDKNDGTATDTGEVSGSDKIAPEPSPEKPEAGVNGRGRGASRPKREFRPARVIGGGPERKLEIERRFGDLEINGCDEKPAAAVERRPVSGRSGGGFGITSGRGRWHTAAGGGMVWVRKTTSS
ncbi:zinc finger CCCH domain-containing protein 18 [Cocos nucifera]|uniref:Zinc finger CCCH domain-containing protein 18 n=1 Tax=Cocos nucifera TaxID=13894 RepID=A0A8K0ITI2_COCNU|nr:zinc finger CCCH domain-containing protein 18 [Cocos nucifera]